MPEPDSLWPETTSDSGEVSTTSENDVATTSTSDTIVDEVLAGTNWTREDVNVALNVAQVVLFCLLVYLEVKHE